MEPWEIATALSMTVLAGVGILWLALTIAKDESETTVIVVDSCAEVAIGDIVYVEHAPDKGTEFADRLGCVIQVNGRTLTVSANASMLPVP